MYMIVSAAVSVGLSMALTSARPFIDFKSAHPLAGFWAFVGLQQTVYWGCIWASHALGYA